MFYMNEILAVNGFEKFFRQTLKETEKSFFSSYLHRYNKVQLVILDT